MEITEVRVKLINEQRERLKAFCFIVFDNAFVVRDLKVVQGVGGLFVAMPSRKKTFRCPRCQYKNHLKSRYCNECGHKFAVYAPSEGDEYSEKIFADIAHPINAECRAMIQNRVLAAYEEEKIRAQDPEYRSKYDDFLDPEPENRPTEFFER